MYRPSLVAFPPKIQQVFRSRTSLKSAILSRRNYRSSRRSAMVLFRKAMILSHRYLGIALSLLFVVWFASGITMMYAGGMPRLTPDERLERLAAGRSAGGPSDAGRSRRRRRTSSLARRRCSRSWTAPPIVSAAASRCSPTTAIFSKKLTRSKRAAHRQPFHERARVTGHASRHDHGTRPVDHRPEPPDAAAQVSDRRSRADTGVCVGVARAR